MLPESPIVTVGRWLLVLYHCCMSLYRAGEIARDGFPDGELVALTAQPPYVTDPDQSHAVVLLGAPFDFRFEDYPLHVTADGRLERLVPASLLNRLEKAVWPV